MKINRQGITRIVFVFNRIVIKVPRLNYGWENFLRGWIANIDEAQYWAWNSGEYYNSSSELVCPVLWSSWLSFLNIMPRVDVERHENEMKHLEFQFGTFEDIKKFRDEYYSQWIKWGLGSDNKPDNFGYMGGRLVKVDYK